MADDSDLAEANQDVKPFKYLSLLLFGGTGPTGLEVIKQALEFGHEVTVVARTPEKLKHIQHKHLKVVKGDAYNIETFEPEMIEKDAVLSCLGSPAIGPWATTTLYSDTIKPILEAMKRSHVERLVVLTSWCSRIESNNPWFFEWILRPLLLGGALKDITAMEEIIENTDSEEITYTIVRPPQLTYAAGNRNYKIEEGLFNVSGVTASRIPRADVAHFMLLALQSEEYDRKEISIASL